MKFTSMIISVTALLFLLSTPFTVYASDVTDRVRSTVEGVLNILKDQSLRSPEKKEGRRALMRNLIKDRFSFEEMSKLSLARHWRKRSAEERKEFVLLFSDLVESAYIDKIERYTDEEILYGAEKIKDGRAVVKTRIMSKGTEVPIDYKLKKMDGDWKVYDILVEGVSLISNYRSQFSSIIRTSSYEELVIRLKEKTAKK